MNPNTPYAPPATSAQGAKELYEKVPSYRRNNTCSTMLLVALLAAFVAPFFARTALAAAGPVLGLMINLVLGAPLLIVCVIVLTGDVYYDQLDDKGALKKWGIANKVVAALILIGWAYSLARAFM